MKHLFQKPLLGVPVNWSHPLARGLVGCWLMNEGGGNVLCDLVNRFNVTGAGTTGLPTWTAGNRGQALSYVLANAQYHEKIATPLITSYPLSVVVWFNSNSIGDQGLFFLGYNGNLTQHQYLWLDSGVLLASSRNTLLYSATAGFYTQNVWNMAVGVWASSTSRKAYLNGVPGTENTDSSTFASTHNCIAIGRRSTSLPAHYMSGKIGLAMVWNRALSDAEIAQLYREPFAMFDRPSIGLLYVPPAGGQTILDYERSHRGVARGILVGVA